MQTPATEITKVILNTHTTFISSCLGETIHWILAIQNKEFRVVGVVKLANLKFFLSRCDVHTLHS